MTTDNNPSPIITLSDVTIEFDHRTILRDVNLQLNRGDFMVITGPNGGGKTTLLRTMLRLIRPSQGSVIHYDNNVKPTHSLSIGYLPQKSQIDTRFPITVEEVVLSGLYNKLRPHITDEAHLILDEILHTVGADQFRHQPIGELSGGQLQRTLLGRALISRPELIVLDEPLSYVDKQFEHQIYGLVSQASQHATIVLVSHEISIISKMANRHIIVDHSLTPCLAHSHQYSSSCE